jgi:twitching motility protein PilT
MHTSMKALDLLREAALQKASDIHIVPDASPLLRIDGQLLPLKNWRPYSAAETQQLVLELLTEPQRVRLAQDYSVDFSLNIENTRYRGNVLFQRNGLEAVFRLIPTEIPTPEELMIPLSVTNLANLKSGLVLVTGQTGAGKSTTMASLLDLINQRRHGNIITIEDPIEFVHSNKNCVVSQREVGLHVASFSAALRSVMRQDPDVVMIGEMRDLETISAAITVAETGHLVFATLHSADAAQAIDRMIDVFPGRQQQQIRTQLSGVLKAVIAQLLLPRANESGRIAVREIMIVNPAISNQIRQGKTHEIYSAIEMGAREGMISLSRALSDLMSQGLIAAQEISRQIGQEPMMHRRRVPDSKNPSATA